MLLWRNYILLDGYPEENAVGTAAILEFFVVSSTPQGVKNHISSGHEPQGTTDKWEVYILNHL